MTGSSSRPGHARHRHVEHDDVRRAALLHDGERLGGGVGAHDAMARLLEADGDELTQVGVVVDDEHSRHRRPHTTGTVPKVIDATRTA